MYIRINGFLPDPSPDTSLKYVKKIPEHEGAAIMEIMEWSSIEAGFIGEHEASAQQKLEISKLLGDPSINELEIYISTSD